MIMMNFYQFYDKLNGKPYEDGVPAPVPYELRNITDDVDTSSYELKPLTPEDMASSERQSPEEYAQLHKGKKMGLGKPMTDEELNKFYGHTW